MGAAALEATATPEPMPDDPLDDPYELPLLPY